MSELFSKGTEIWITDKEQGWRLATILSSDGGKEEGTTMLQVELNDAPGQVRTIGPLKETDLNVKNPARMDGVDDMTTLSYLHEPAVLNCIDVRYARGIIYTYSGIVLVAVNPFQNMPGLYTSDMISAYRGVPMGQLDPHLFAVAEEAFTRMARLSESQSVIVSGESGAGKTVSAKYIMRYLATVGGVDASGSMGGSGKSHAESTQIVEKQIMASNPLMEALGNAKTTRNDNSSRFGKYIQIHFNTSNRIKGASIRTYLLEKSRVVFHAKEERTYHVFYQMCAGASDTDRAAWKLGGAIADYKYVSWGNPIVDSIDDKADYEETRKAMTTVGITVDQQQEIFRLLAAVLHLGNVAIIGARRSTDSSVIDSDNDAALKIVCEFLGADREQLAKWMTNRMITVGREKVVKPMNQHQANDTRDALAKVIYAKIFDWVVARVNDSLKDSGAGAATRAFIGILDIYGFESFEVNSFEQFCINYANENLQQQFNRHVFKLEQEEYVREEIVWSFIGFVDNQPCLDLIEAKLGILDLLEEECKLPNGTDDNFTQKLVTAHKAHAFFLVPKIGKGVFTVKHYAHSVTYSSENFIEKNRDKVADELLSLVRGSPVKFLAMLFADDAASASSSAPKGTEKGKANSAKLTTVGSQFRASLSALMDTIYHTNTHYVRCIKPNMTKEPFVFDRLHVLEQLRACGVLETIRISAAGYPTKMLYAEFRERYRLFLPRDKATGAKANLEPAKVREACSFILASTFPETDYQLGKTKIFLRAGKLAVLERKREKRLAECAVKIQSSFRRFYYEKRYRKLRAMAINLQARIRGVLARRLCTGLRRTKAATAIQARWRGHIKRAKFLAIRSAALALQRRARGVIARREKTALLREKSARILQRLVRGWLVRRRYRKSVRQVVILQCLWRRKLAVRQLRALREEARSVNRLIQVNYALDNKVIELQQKLDSQVAAGKELDETVRSLKTQLSTLEKSKGSATEEVAELRAKVKADKAAMDDLQAQLEALRKENAALKQREATLVGKVGALEASEKANQASLKKLEEEKGALAVDNERLKKEVEELQQRESLLQSITPSASMNKLSSAAENQENRAEAVNVGVQTSSSPTTEEPRTPVKTNPAASVDAGTSMTPFRQRMPSMVPASPAGAMSGGHKLVKRTESLAVTDELSAQSDSLGLVPEEEFETSIALLSYDPDDTQMLLDVIIRRMKPALVKSKPVPAQVILHCLRYDVYLNRPEQLAVIMPLIAELLDKKLVEVEQDFAQTAFWLSNCIHLYLGFTNDKGPVKVSTAELVQDLEKILTRAYRRMIELLEEQLSPLVLAVLEHEQAPGVPISKPVSSFLGIFKSRPADGASQAKMHLLLQFLSEKLAVLKQSYTEPSIMVQAFATLFTFMDGQLVNRLLLRRDLCTFNRGIHIEFNLDQLRLWARANGLPEKSSWSRLIHIREAAMVLQLRKKTLDDMDAIAEKCGNLNAVQLQKILAAYHHDDFDETVSSQFIQRGIAAANRLAAARSGSSSPTAVTAPMSPMSPGKAEAAAIASTLVVTESDVILPPNLKARGFVLHNTKLPDHLGLHFLERMEL